MRLCRHFRSNADKCYISQTYNKQFMEYIVHGSKNQNDSN